MRLLSSSAVAAVLALSMAGAAPPQAMAQVSFSLSVGFPPPPLPVYEQPPIPAPDEIWIPGYWAWDDEVYDYYWVPGTWTQAPEPGLLWTPGYWGWQDGNYVFNDGYWGPQVGYYGGVDYGFGYGGDAYEGGYWRDNHFFYNRAVNNVSNTNINITNVYSKTVVNNHSQTASFNGPGGATARPTPQQTQIAHQHHVAPTAMQVQNVRAAAATPALRASANHGAPPVAAVAKPGVFKGPGVVMAAKAGGDYHTPAAAVARQAQAKAAHPVYAPPNAVRPGVPASADARVPAERTMTPPKAAAHPSPAAAEPAPTRSEPAQEARRPVPTEAPAEASRPETSRGEKTRPAPPHEAAPAQPRSMTPPPQPRPAAVKPSAPPRPAEKAPPRPEDKDKHPPDAHG